MADAADRELASGKLLGPLHGLPIAFKDMESAGGFPFTKGSPGTAPCSSACACSRKSTSSWCAR